MSEKIKYYSLKPILEDNATYHVILGARLYGKNYAIRKWATMKGNMKCQKKSNTIR